MFSNAFTPFQNCSLWAVAFATHGKSVRRGSAPPFSSHVRWGEPGFPVTPLRDTTACAPFSKERRMKFAEATNLDRKSGERGAPASHIHRALAWARFLRRGGFELRLALCPPLHVSHRMVVIMGKQNQPLLRDCPAQEALALLNAGEGIEVVPQYPSHIQVRRRGNEVGYVAGT